MTIALAKANLPYRPFAENFADKTLAAPPAQPAWGDAHVFGRAGSTTGKGADPRQLLRDMALMEKPSALASARGVQVAAEGGGIDFGGPEEAALWGAGLLVVTLIAALAAAGGPAGVVALGSGLAKGWTLYLGAGLGILGLTSAFGDILTIPLDTVTTLVGYLLGKVSPTNLSEVPQLVLEGVGGQRIDLIKLLKNQNAPQEAQDMLRFFSHHKISGIPGMRDLTRSQYYDLLRNNGLSHEDAVNGTFQAMAYAYNQHLAREDRLWKNIPNPLKFFGEKLHEITSRNASEPEWRVGPEQRVEPGWELMGEGGQFPTYFLGVSVDEPNQCGLTIRQITKYFAADGLGSSAVYAAKVSWTDSDYECSHPGQQHSYDEGAAYNQNTDPNSAYESYMNEHYGSNKDDQDDSYLDFITGNNSAEQANKKEEEEEEEEPCNPKYKYRCYDPVYDLGEPSPGDNGQVNRNPNYLNADDPHRLGSQGHPDFDYAINSNL